MTHRLTIVDQGRLRMPSNPTARLTACLERLLYSDLAWVIGGLALAVAEAFTTRHAMNPDGLSYVEMAQTGYVPAALRPVLLVRRDPHSF